MARIKETLYETTYFVLNKRDLRSPSAAVVVEPPGYLTCGNGSPPDDSPRVDLVEVWR
jgi:hypothetical protein